MLVFPTRAFPLKNDSASVFEPRRVAHAECPLLPKSGHTRACIEMSASLIGHSGSSTFRLFTFDVARRLALLFGIGTRALPSWDSKSLLEPTRKSKATEIYRGLLSARLCRPHFCGTPKRAIWQRGMSADHLLSNLGVANFFARPSLDLDNESSCASDVHVGVSF
jgi:hypothetical protein